MGKKKKILFVSTKSLPGGAQKYVYDLATHLPRNEFDVLVAAGGTDRLKKQIERAGIPYIEIKNFQRDVRLKKEFAAFFELIKLFKKYKPDIIHLNGSKAGTMGALAAKLSLPSAKTIYSTHGLPYFEQRSRRQNKLIFFSMKIAGFFLDTIIAISRFDYENALKRRIIQPRKLVFIPISVEPHAYEFLPKNEAKTALSRKLGVSFPDDTFIVGTIAEYTKNKGLSYLIDALARLEPKNSKLQAILIGWGEQQEELKSKINALGLGKHIMLLAGTGEDYQYVKAFDVFVLPSVKEGLPYTLLETALAEVPIIATAAGGSPEVVLSKETGIAVPRASIDELAKAIMFVARNPQQARAFAQKAKQHVLANFTFDKMLQDTLTVYRT